MSPCLRDIFGKLHWFKAPTNNTFDISLDTRMRLATGGTWYRCVAAGTSDLNQDKA